MTRNDINIDDFLDLHRSGMNGKQLAEHFGVGTTTVHRWLKEFGLKTSKRRDIDLIALRELYDREMPVRAIARKFGVASTVIVDRLNEIGISPRNRSEAMYVRMSHTTAEERRRLTDAAHAAVRGMSHTEEHRCKIATAREVNQSYITRTECLFAGMLNERGISSTPQKAFGRYNVDISLDEFPIVVEICGGGWHGTGAHAARYAKRTKYLLDRGVYVVTIWLHPTQSPLESGAADYVVALTNELGSQKPARGKEKMIRGDGQSTSTGQRKFNNLPMIPCSERRNDITGRFEACPFDETIEM